VATAVRRLDAEGAAGVQARCIGNILAFLSAMEVDLDDSREVGEALWPVARMALGAPSPIAGSGASRDGRTTDAATEGPSVNRWRMPLLDDVREAAAFAKAPPVEQLRRYVSTHLNTLATAALQRRQGTFADEAWESLLALCGASESEAMRWVVDAALAHAALPTTCVEKAKG